MKATKYKKSTANEHTKAAKEQMEALVSFKFHSFGHFSNGGRSDMDLLFPKATATGVWAQLCTTHEYLF